MLVGLAVQNVAHDDGRISRHFGGRFGTRDRRHGMTPLQKLPDQGPPHIARGPGYDYIPHLIHSILKCGAAMRYFLAKTDPETYSIDQFAAERRTVWDGVRNPQALRAVREMRPGDLVFIYHSMSGAAIVGLAKVASEPRGDPTDPKLVVIDFEFVRRIEPPVTLKEIKDAAVFEDWYSSAKAGFPR